MSETTVQTEPDKVTIDPQDPLPESNWKWRRWTFVGCVVVILWLLYLAIRWNQPGAYWPLTVCFLMVWLIYGIAPSAEQFGKIAQAVSAMKDGVVFKTATTATTAAGTTATATTSAAKPTNVSPEEK